MPHDDAHPRHQASPLIAAVERHLGLDITTPRAVAEAERLTSYADRCERDSCGRWHPWRVPRCGGLLCPACAGWIDYLKQHGVGLQVTHV